MSETLHSVVIGLDDYGQEALTFLSRTEECSICNSTLDIKMFSNGVNFDIALQSEQASQFSESIAQADMIFFVAENYSQGESTVILRMIENVRNEHSLSIALTPNQISETVKSDLLSHVDSVIEVPRIQNNSTPHQPSAAVILWLLDMLTRDDALIAFDLSDLKLMLLSSGRVCRCGFAVADTAYDEAQVVTELTSGHSLTKADLSKAQSCLIAFKGDLDCDTDTCLGIQNAVEGCCDEFCSSILSIMTHGQNGKIDILVIA